MTHHASSAVPDQTARPHPLCAFPNGDRVSVLYARGVYGGTPGQLPRFVELVLVEHPHDQAACEANGARWWADLELDNGREVMAERYAIVLQARRSAPGR